MDLFICIWIIYYTIPCKGKLISNSTQFTKNWLFFPWNKVVTHFFSFQKIWLWRFLGSSNKAVNINFKSLSRAHFSVDSVEPKIYWLLWNLRTSKMSPTQFRQKSRYFQVFQKKNTKIKIDASQSNDLHPCSIPKSHSIHETCLASCATPMGFVELVN